MASSKADWLIPSGLIGLAFVPMVAGAMRVVQLANSTNFTPDTARFFADRGWFILHIATVVGYSLLGALQFSPGLRRRSLPWHRAAGWFLIPCGLLSAVSGLWLAHRRGAATFAGPLPGDYDGNALYGVRLVVGVAMIFALILATAAVRRRDIPGHRAWMIRAYALGLGAGTQVFTHIPWFITSAVHNETWRTIFMAVAWALNAAVAEWLIRRSSRPRAKIRAETRETAVAA